jgi:hypothetical protein
MTIENGCGRVDGKQAWQYAEAAKGALVDGVKELVAPRDRCIHRLLPVGKVARGAARRHRVVLQSAEQTIGRQHLDPGATSASPTASAIADATRGASRIAASGTNTTRVTPSAATSLAISSATRVFPTPPGPVTVTRRTTGSESH